jgi:hypothetical protein
MTTRAWMTKQKSGPFQYIIPEGNNYIKGHLPKLIYYDLLPWAINPHDSNSAELLESKQA